MEKEQKKNNNRIYSSVFKEELHFIILKSNQTLIFQLSENHFISKKLNFLKIKKNINKIHYSCFSKKMNILFFQFCTINFNSFNYSIVFILTQIIFLFCFDLYTYKLSILEKISSFNFSPHLRKKTKYLKNRYLLNTKDISINTTLHRIFLFLEHNSQLNNSIIKGKIDSYIHPELIIRILRKYLKDTCMLNVLRNIFVSTIFFYKENILSIFYLDLFKKNIFNILGIEIDHYSIKKILIVEQTLNQEYLLQNNRINFIKWKIIEFKSNIYNIYNFNHIKQLFINKKNKYIVGLYTVHYLRNQLSFILLIDGYYDLKILLYRNLNRFLKRRMNIKLLYSQNSLTNSFQYSNFLIQIKIREINLNIVGYILNHAIYMKRQYSSISIDIYTIIEYLYSSRICAHNGYPIIKLSWTSLNDSRIITNFQRIYENVLFLFSGIMNHKLISYCYHIINDSCLKTLAGKHKTNIQSILLELNYNYNINLQLYKGSIKFRRNLLKPLNNIIRIRAWHIDIINEDICDTISD